MSCSRTYRTYTTMKILIRLAKKGEGAAITECFRESCVHRCKLCYNKFLCNNKLDAENLVFNIDKHLSKYNKNRCTVVAVDKDSSKIVGFATFSGNKFVRTNHRIDLGWSVNMNYANHGIATKMVSFLIKEAKKRGFKKLEAEVAVENLPSIKLAKKLGFEIEGRKKSSLSLEDGKYIDTFMFGKVL